MKKPLKVNLRAFAELVIILVIPLVSTIISAKISISMICGFFINLGESLGEIPINSPR